VLQSGVTGAPIATLDGTRLTVWRTAAASALAARYLARADAKRLMIVGAGQLAPFLARAHASVRPIERIAVWNHRPEGARRLTAALSGEGFKARAVDRLEDGVRDADIISCATLSEAPLVAGAWLKAGQHLDLVGAFTMRMREADDAALKRARIFVDTEAAMSEGGDVALGLKSGAITRADVAGDLAALVRGGPARGGEHEITLFKSVGAAIEDLAAAMLVWRKAGG
jgi:ornithine cyclodeaminase